MKLILLLLVFTMNTWAQLYEDEIFDGCGTTYRCPNFTKVADYSKSVKIIVNEKEVNTVALSQACSSFSTWTNEAAAKDQVAIQTCNRMCTAYETQCPFGEQTDPKMWINYKFHEMAFENGKSVCKCNRYKLFKEKTGSILSDQTLDKIANEINVLSNGKKVDNANEVYGPTEEFEYKKHVCKEFLTNRKTPSFIRDTAKFTTETAYKHLNAFNVLLQIAASKKFPGSSCLDFKLDDLAKDAPLDSAQKLKLSFSFKGAYLAGEAKTHMEETEKIGFILNKFSDFRLVNSKITYPTAVNIHGFADQQFYAPRKAMTYINKAGETKTQHYNKNATNKVSDSNTESTATPGLYDGVLDAKALTQYPVIEELTKLEELLKNKHMVFPFGETTDEKLKASFENYMSDVEVNELLALNRAIQTKRALKKHMTDFKFDYMEVGKNASSSCKNMIGREAKYTSADVDFPKLSIKGTDVCDRRRATVVEADVTTYSKMVPSVAGGGSIEGITYKPGAYYYANCVVGKGADSVPVSEEALKYVLFGEAGASSNDYAKTQFLTGGKNYNQAMHERLTTASFSIADVLMKSNPSVITAAKIGADIKASTKSDGVPEFRLDALNYPLTIDQIAEILSQPVFRFFTYPLPAKTATGPWKMVQKNFATYIATDIGNSFQYFKHTRMYLDKKCAFTKLYANNQVTNLPIDKAHIKTLILNGPVTATNGSYDVAREDCIVFPQKLMFTNNCRQTDSPPSDGKMTDAVPASNIFPHLGFDGTAAKEAKFEGDPLEGLVKLYGMTDIATAVSKVNEMLCISRTGDGYKKPTADEQTDCP